MSLNPQEFRKVEFIHRVGLSINRPLASDVLVGTLYFSTDLNLLERSDGTNWTSYSGSSGESLPTDDIGKVLISQGDGNPPIFSSNPELVAPDASIGFKATNRVYTVGISNPDNGTLVFGRTDATQKLGIGFTFSGTGEPASIISSDQPGGDLLGFVLNNGTIVFTPGQGAGVKKVQFGRRISDSHPVTGAATEFWAGLGQTDPVIASLSPGGVDKTFWVMPDGSVHAPNGLSDTPLNGSNVSSGTINDARLSSNVPLKNQQNVFTNQQHIEYNDPAFVLSQNTQPLDQKKFRFVNSTQRLYFQAVNDAITAVQNQASLDRLGNFASPTFYPIGPDSSNPLYLDRYEEGGWLPTFNGDAGTATGQTYSVQVGKYVRVGRVVQVDFDIFISNLGTGGSGNLIISSLPFINGSSNHSTGIIGYFFGLAGGAISINIISSAGTAHCACYYKSGLSSGMDGQLSYSNLQVGTGFIGSMTYITT